MVCVGGELKEGKAEVEKSDDADEGWFGEVDASAGKVTEHALASGMPTRREPETRAVQDTLMSKLATRLHGAPCIRLPSPSVIWQIVFLLSSDKDLGWKSLYHQDILCSRGFRAILCANTRSSVEQFNMNRKVTTGAFSRMHSGGLMMRQQQASAIEGFSQKRSIGYSTRYHSRNYELENGWYKFWPELTRRCFKGHSRTAFVFCATSRAFQQPTHGQRSCTAYISRNHTLIKYHNLCRSPHSQAADTSAKTSSDINLCVPQTGHHRRHLVVGVDPEALVLGNRRKLDVFEVELLLHDLFERLEHKSLGLL